VEKIDFKSVYLSVLTACVIVVSKGVQLLKVLPEKYKEVNFKRRVRRQGVYTKREIKYKLREVFTKIVKVDGNIIKYKSK
tara:strand:- start:11028 stop:11267 length:240 start_codon:yes stop_codon:yes gene_type:complete